MKKTYLLSLLLAVALVVVSYQLYAQKHQDVKVEKPEIKSTEQAVLENIHKRKSVRFFTEQELTKDQLVTILKAGMAAPTGHDKRPWQFVTITDKSVMKELRKGLVWAKGLDTSPAAIVVCGDMHKVDKRNPQFWITDTSAATQNMLLAIEAMGLGGVWCTIYPGEDRMDYARKVLNLPDYIMPLAVVPVGYSQGREKPKEKYDPKNIHWQKW